MKTRLLSITLLLFILHFTGCNKKSVPSPEAVPITFSGAFELVETKAGRELVGVDVPDIYAQVVGSLKDNDFTNIYSYADEQVGSNIRFATLDQKVTFIDGAGNLERIVHYPLSHSGTTPVYVRAYAPSDIAERDTVNSPNKVTFTDLTGREAVMMTLANTTGVAGIGSGTDQPEYHEIKLTFKYKLSKISFTLIAENADAITEWGTISNITLMNYPNNITLSLDKTETDGDYTVNREVAATASPILYHDEDTPLIPTQAGTPVPTFLLIPPSDFGDTGDTCDPWTISITSSMNGTRELTLTGADALLAAGHHYTFKIKLMDNQEFGFLVTEASWNEGSHEYTPDI